MRVKEKRSVLVIEDDSNDAFLLGEAFVQLGHLQDLHFVGDAKKAIDYLTGHGKYLDRVKYPLPQIILVDLKLPGMSGLEFITWIRAQPQHAVRTVIVFSASDHPDDICVAMRQGANSYACKPIAMEKTVEFVRQLYSYWYGFHEFIPEGLCVDLPEQEREIEADKETG